MRVLIIGTGSIGCRHMASLKRLLPDVHFYVLREAGRDRDAAALGDVEVVGTLDKAIALNPDLIVIASPSALHLRPLLAAIESGVPFYVEKPVVTTMEDLAVLQELVDRSKLASNMVGCNLRSLPSLMTLKSLLSGGRLGSLVRADFEAGQWLPDWRPTQDYRHSYSAKSSLGGGVIFDLIHEIDAAHWLLGDFDYVSGYTTKASTLEIDSNDCASLLLARPEGPIATIRIDYVSRRPVRRYTLVGDVASATWDLHAQTLILSDLDGVRLLPQSSGAFDVSETYVAAMREMLAAIKENRPSTQPIEEGLRTLATALRAMEI